MRVSYLALCLCTSCVVSCQTTQSTTESTGRTTTTTSRSGAYPASTTSSSTGYRSVEGSPVLVTLNEYVIEMPDALRTGPTTFRVTNYGKLPHSFEIHGQGLEGKLARPLNPGHSDTLQLELRAGSYTVYCPVGNHVAAHGMARTLTVQ